MRVLFAGAIVAGLLGAGALGYWAGTGHPARPPAGAPPAPTGAPGASVSASGAAGPAGQGAAVSGAPPTGDASTAGATATTGGGTGQADGRKVLYWYDPMVPGQKFDKPGKSPFMDMALVPKYADEADAAGVGVSSRLQQSLGVRTVAVHRAKLESAFSAVGSVQLDERSVTTVAARSNGIVERLAVRATGDPVRRGTVLATLHVPEWAGLQAEYLAIRNARLPRGEELIAAARSRLKIAFMPEDVIAAVEATGTPQPRVTLTSPIDGYVAEIGARDGAQVTLGMPLFRLASLASVWVQIDVPESQSALVRPGVTVEARAAGDPGRVFAGRVEVLLPDVDPATRTLKARVVLANPGNGLRPGMYAAVRIAGPGLDALVVPQEAVITTGRRTVVIVAEPGGRFRSVDVKVGREAGDQAEIVSGLAEGDRVVASGQFLIDSEASLRAVLPRLGEAAADSPAGAPGGTPPSAYTAEGSLDAIAGDALTISHGPVPALKWPPMQMQFKPPGAGLPPGLKPGASIRFEFVKTPDGDWQVTKIESAAGRTAR